MNRRAPIIQKLAQRRAWRPDYRGEGLDAMVLGAAVMAVGIIVGLLAWGGP